MKGVFKLSQDIISRFLGGGKEILLNYIINRIPCWTIRKIIYSIFGMKIGKGARIGIKTMVTKPQKIRIGERSVVNEYCHLDGRGGLTIGNDVSVSIYSVIITASHHINSDTFEYFTGPVEIQNNVWLGTRSIVLNDSIVRTNSIIGAGCVFKGVSEENSIYVGNPAVLIKKRCLSKEYNLSYSPFFI